MTDNRDEPDKYLFSGAVLEPYTFLLLWADSSEGALGFKLDNEGGEVGLRGPDGQMSVVTYGVPSADFSVARSSDCCEGSACLGWSFRGTPGTTNDPTTTVVPYVSTGSTWKYLDTGVDPGADWVSPTFDDSAWLGGAGPLGYGDTHQVTVLGYGGVDTTKYTTAWFRLTFDNPVAPVPLALTAGVLRDDGAVVYLNGSEVWRTNMPDGVVTADTIASTSAGSGDETAYWEGSLDPAVLLPGTNTLAVEVHQFSRDSSDLGFDLTLTATFAGAL